MMAWALAGAVVAVVAFVTFDRFNRHLEAAVALPEWRR